MSDPTLIADLIRAGVDADLVQRVALELGRASAEREAIEKRRQADRERQARRRGHVMSRDVTLQHVTPRDVTGGPNGPAPLPPHTPPITPTPNTIPPVSPDGLPAPEGADDVAAEVVVEAGDPEADEGGSKGAKTSRARRIPADFAESPEALAVCAEMGLTSAEASEALAEFCDFWMAEGGQRARKLDWPRTLRNRLREIGRRRPAARASPPRPRSSNGFYDILRDELAGSDDQRSDPQQRQHLRLASGAR